MNVYINRSWTQGVTQCVPFIVNICGFRNEETKL